MVPAIGFALAWNRNLLDSFTTLLAETAYRILTPPTANRVMPKIAAISALRSVTGSINTGKRLAQKRTALISLSVNKNPDRKLADVARAPSAGRRGSLWGILWVWFLIKLRPNQIR